MGIRRIAIASCLLICLMVAVAASAGNMKITYFGTHTGCVIETPSGKVYVYDPGLTGEFYDTDTTGGMGMGTYLRKQGITTIHGMAISHPHGDHYDAGVQMFQDFNVLELIDTGFNPNNNSNGGYNSAFWTAFQNASATRRTGLRRGDVLTWDPEITVEVRGPRDPFWSYEEAGSDPERHFNANCLVLLIYHGDVAHYITGDIIPPAQNYLQDNAPIKTKEAAMMSIPHHGKWYFHSGFANDFGKDHPLARVGFCSEDHTEKGAAADMIQEWRGAGIDVYAGDGNNRVTATTFGGNEFLIEETNPDAAKIYSIVSNYSHAPFFTANGQNYFDVAYTPASRLTQFSVSAWFRTGDNTPTTLNKILVNKGGFGTEAPGDNMNYGIWMLPSGQIEAGYETTNGANVFVQSPTALNNGQWHHATVTYDGSVLRLYINGVQVDLSSNPASPDNLGTGPFRVGGNTSSGDCSFIGDIDEVRVWNRAISGGEIHNQKFGGRLNFDGLLFDLDMACQKLNGNNFFALPSLRQFRLTNFVLQTQFRTTAPPPTTQVSMIVNKGGFGSDASGQNMNYGLWIDGNGFLCGGFEAANGTDVFAVSSRTVNDGQWHTAKVDFSGSAVILFLDGVEIARANTALKPDSGSNAEFRIGANSLSNNRYFTGDVDYVQLINPGITTTYWDQLKFSEYQIDVLPPVITQFAKTNQQFSVTIQRVPNTSYSLWRTTDVASPTWTKLLQAVIVTNGASTVTLTDPTAGPAQCFYRVTANNP